MQEQGFMEQQRKIAELEIKVNCMEIEFQKLQVSLLNMFDEFIEKAAKENEQLCKEVLEIVDERSK